MSYDVSIGDKSFNYTGNVSRLFYDHIPSETSNGGLHELHGRTGKQACVILQKAFERLSATRRDLYVDRVAGEPRFCEKYDAKNGWGSAVGALMFLGEILAACAEFPRHKVDVNS